MGPRLISVKAIFPLRGNLHVLGGEFAVAHNHLPWEYSQWAIAML